MELKDYILKRFDNPDEVRTFEKGKYEIVKLGDSTFGRVTYQPDWRWSTHVNSLAGTETCEVDHLGLGGFRHARVFRRPNGPGAPLRHTALT